VSTPPDQSTTDPAPETTGEFAAAAGSALPVVVDGTWCGNCPYLKLYGKQYDLTARCALKDVELDWYDYWIAACAGEEALNAKLTD
jgi:hypothetical protein